MLATIIIDAFRADEKTHIADALDELCCPHDNHGWASAGIYSYWNVVTKEIYYIGLAVDLAQRFRQHTGLIPCDPKGCKIDKITEHFRTNDLLGYSIFVQSCLSQPVIAATAARLGRPKKDIEEEYGEIVQQGHEEIKLAEGFLIEAHRRQGERPMWNEIGGSKLGQSVIYKNEGMLLDCLTASNTGPILARSSLRQLSADDTAEHYEEVILHTVRLNMLRLGMDFQTAFDRVDDILNTRARILADNYLNRKPVIPGITI